MPFKFHISRRLAILMHILGWVIIVLIPRYLLNAFGAGSDDHFLNQFYFNTAIYGTLFYLNYLWLVPKFFLNNRKLLYFLLTIGIILGLYTIMAYVNDRVFADPERERWIAKVFQELAKDKNEVQPPIREFKIYNYFYTSVLVCGFSMGLSVLEKLTQNEKVRKELEREKLNSELAFLKSQVSPHFFFNTLNNIYSLIGIDTDEAQGAVLKLSKLMRYLLYDSDDGNSRLTDEINFMNNYIDLMKLRISNKVELHVEMPDRVPEIRIPPLLFIAFVENAFKHGISYREHSFIEVTMKIDGDKLYFSTRNSLGKNSAEGETKHSGIGLENVKKRLTLLYPQAHELSISRTNTEFGVKLEIDYKKART